ncbi:hypothetical protein [Leptospira bouyouniensis]|uniref:Helicase/UvrB N-terminal domain-containing protein n=1 Tax=Leptospira bouyouniensis TaxID=2484911 RepID=A0ABY2L9S9_9LEPT|nr:hypothetical protein [Leptospira bouyouniensis]TGK54245.1 hypothetical protein EHQ10_00325 [Leptospira bouyouniensis]
MGGAIPKLKPNTKRYSIEKLREEFDYLIEKAPYLDYKVFQLTFNPIFPYPISVQKIIEIVTQTFQNLENKYLNSELKISQGNKTYLCFPKIAIIHTTENFHTSNHIHMLVIMPEYLIEELTKKYQEILLKKVGRAIPNLDIARYYDSCKNFLSYTLRKSFFGENKSVYDEVLYECSRFFYGSPRTKFQHNISYTDFYFTNQHLDIKQKLDISFPSPSLEEARTQLQNLLHQTIQNPTHNMNVISSQVGTGKSFAVNLLPETIKNKKILLLVKRLENIAEFPNFTALPSLPISVKRYLEAKSKDSVYTTKWLDQLNLEDDLELKIHQAYQDYIQECNSIISNNQFIVTTHAKFFKSNLSKEKFDTIIFDECILDSFFEFQTLKINLPDCLNHFKFLRSKKRMSEILNLQGGQTTTIKLSKDEKILLLSILDISISNPTLFSKKYPNLKSNELRFLEMLLNPVHILMKGNEYCILKESHLPTDKTYVVLSATPLLPLYEKLFQNDLRVLKVKSPKLLSKITRISENNISKTDLLKPENKELAQKFIADYRNNGFKVISYKELKADLHFYATTSQNNIKGENLFILGTPIPGSEYFKLLVTALGIGDGKDCNFDLIEKTRIKISNQNSSKSYNSIYYYKISKKDEINELYYLLAKNELIQAIGRSRPHEFETNIIIFSIVEIPEYD